MPHGKLRQLVQRCPKDFPYAEAVRIYREAGKKYDIKDQRLPLTEKEFRRALSPAEMVLTRTGTGGPQPQEVARMVAAAKDTLIATARAR